MNAAVGKAAPNLLHYASIASFRTMRRSLQPAFKVGFVPTMGALHEGHLSLMQKARQDNDIVIASIFVNPTQFGEGEDFDKYPRQLEKDAERIAECGVDYLFAPQKDDMYGTNHVTYIEPEGFDSIPEGTARPGHFRGVATIVTKLFNIVQPTNAYFGQKDAAQCVLIKRVVHDLDLDVNVVILDTIREEDGLAMSSRNAYLSPVERKAAPAIYRSLLAGKDFYQRHKEEVHSTALRQTVHDVLSQEPLVSEIQYVSVDNKETMQPIVDTVGTHGAVISLACKIGGVRLIDNIIL